MKYTDYYKYLLLETNDEDNDENEEILNSVKDITDNVLTQTEIVKYENDTLKNKLLESNTFKGEYWIQDGYAQMADSNIDMGHEAYVIQNATCAVLSDLEIYCDEPYLPNMEEEMFEAMEDELPDEIKEKYENDEINMEELLIWYGKNVLNNPKYEDLVKAAYDHIDVRRFAMKEWGWKAIRGNTIDTWHLTNGDLSSISHGLYNAYDTELDDYKNEHPDIDDHGYTGPYFDIEVYSVKDFYDSVPIDVIDSGDVTKLRNYKTHDKGKRITEKYK
jgi:hypothetical protein